MTKKKKDWSKNRATLKSITNPAKEAYEIKVSIPELTFEGVRGQPDFAHLYVTFYPASKVIELQSLKEYIFACSQPSLLLRRGSSTLSTTT